MRLITTSVLVQLMVLSLLLISPAHATKWVGNDDGEWQTNGFPSYVFVQDSFNTNMHWTASPPLNYVSLQYNPDFWTSFYNQYFAHWFQTIIFSSPNGCASFSIEIYSTISPGLIWRTDYPGQGCLTVNQILATNAIWYIQEDVSNNHITDVQFSVSNYPNYMSRTLYPPNNNYIWLRSNVCWCGTNGGTTTFDSAGGINYVGSNKNVVPIDPPVTVATAENSNMQYGCWRNPNTLGMYQTFGLNGHC